jgi:hypothetical protein
MIPFRVGLQNGKNTVSIFDDTKIDLRDVFNSIPGNGRLQIK